MIPSIVSRQNCVTREVLWQVFYELSISSSLLYFYSRKIRRMLGDGRMMVGEVPVPEFCDGKEWLASPVVWNWLRGSKCLGWAGVVCMQ